MTTPKPGDRIRAMFEGEVYDGGLFGPRAKHRNGNGVSLSALTEIEILPEPVYENSDSTEFREGDVITNGHDNVYMRGFSYRSLGCCEATATAERLVWRDIAGAEHPDEHMRQPLTLLVRDGKPVTS